MTGTRSSDVEAVLARRHDNGGDYWATTDGRLGVGDPFSTLTSLLILHELRVPASHEAVAGALGLVLASWRNDGRYRMAPSGTLYPCYTAVAARILCRYGYATDPRLERTVAHLLETQHEDGGWRCARYPFGRGPETASSNPGVTLPVLDVLRFTPHRADPRLAQAVESLLQHWVQRTPLGPCHFGIGSRFLRVEYPFLRYNLFYYVYVLSFYEQVRDDPRFGEALALLRSKADGRGRIVVEHQNRKLAHLSFCAPGRASALATGRYREIERNLASTGR